ncbi:MAG: DUF3667 domain-containing protein [Christiangramia sp.]|uniref:DUF3667 domain-containing protein n=1 Tax=Christiangramia sp. TaxID=1931228 RepID=UPI0032425B3A
MENSMEKSEDLQPQPVYPRLTIDEIKTEVLSHLYLEKGLLSTFISMLKRPSKTVEVYLHGNRRKIQNPFRYLIIGVAFSTFIMLANPSFRNYISNIQQSSKGNYDQLDAATGLSFYEKFTQAQEIYMSYQNLVLTLAIPLIALVTFLFFRKKAYNFAEHMAINCLVFGTIYWLSGLFSLVTFFMDYSFIIYLSWFLTFAIGTYLYWKVFSINIFKSMLSILSAYLAAMVVGIFFQIAVFLVLLIL